MCVCFSSKSPSQITLKMDHTTLPTNYASISQSGNSAEWEAESKIKLASICLSVILNVVYFSKKTFINMHFKT